jgi:hypothetical protein
MNDDTTLETSHCRICYQQRAPSAVVESTWAELEPLYHGVVEQIPLADREHFDCGECFPRDGQATIPVCQDCNESLRKEKLPYPCRVNNLALPCVHRYPDELKGLSPLEERLIGIYIPCGWITKVTIDLEKGTSGRYPG